MHLAWGKHDPRRGLYRVRVDGSLELIAICDEIISWLKASMQGLEINAETLALDVIHEHGLSGDFLESRHTLRTCVRIGDRA